MTEDAHPPGHLTNKETLIDLLIHDLTGPLSIVGMSASNLLRKDRGVVLGDQQRRSLERIRRNNHKAQTLLREMIQIFRSEEGLFKKNPFFVEEMLKDAITGAMELIDPRMSELLCDIEDGGEFKHFLERQGIFLRITGKYGRTPFYHDREKVEQIFRNLIGNGLKYRNQRLKISISGNRDLLGLVENDGTEIPPGEQATLFQRFSRLNRHGHIPGLGLGLLGVKALVETMGGGIILKSEPGRGVSFMVRIPTK